MISTNQSTVSRWIWTNESAGLCLSEVPSGTAELEGLDVLSIEKLHLVVPVGHGLLPVILRPTLGLLEDVEILANTKPGGGRELYVLSGGVRSDNCEVMFYCLEICANDNSPTLCS